MITGAFTGTHRAPIISAAARNNVPAVYALSDFARDGALLSYGVDNLDLWRRAASYVDRILRGTKPADLPRSVSDQVRDGREPQDRQGAQPYGAAIDFASRRRDHRINSWFCCTAWVRLAATMLVVAGAAAAGEPSL